MLKRLSIYNYAIIDEIVIGFSPALNIITGETGAGKSILMGALSLILGERADSSVLVNAGRKCFIEGLFTVEGRKDVIAFLENNDLDVEDELVLRREISSNGKSRAFINDTPANLQQMKALASLLVDLHQQFDTLELGDSDFQREVLDALASNETRLQQYRSIFTQWQRAVRELESMQQQKAGFIREFDYNQFLFNELSELGLKENELEDLDNELKVLSNAEAIKTGLTRAVYVLNESDQPVVQVLKQLLNDLNAFATHQPAMVQVMERLKGAYIELQDIADEIERANDAVIYDEERIAFINTRLEEGYKLARKHGVQTTAQLLAIQAELNEKLQAVLDMDDRIAAAEKEVGVLYSEANSIASELSKYRIKQVKPLEQKVNALLAQVGMPNAVLKVEVRDAGGLTVSGSDQIEYLFDANKSNRFEPIRKVASGGELSRLMLCIKSLVAQSIDLPTMIFDEIDTGISGEAARQVGIIMKGLAANRQIICITHQPQIAGKADAHYFVYKEIKDDAVKTNIRELNRDERITAIARMLSGERPTAAALENAREMMN